MTHYIFTNDIEVLRLPKHDYAHTSMKAIWQDYFNQLDEWEQQQKETDYLYNALALQIDINMLKSPDLIEGLNIPPVPKAKLDNAVENFRKTIELFRTNVEKTIDSFLG